MIHLSKIFSILLSALLLTSCITEDVPDNTPRGNFELLAADRLLCETANTFAFVDDFQHRCLVVLRGRRTSDVCAVNETYERCNQAQRQHKAYNLIFVNHILEDFVVVSGATTCLRTDIFFLLFSNVERISSAILHLHF